MTTSVTHVNMLCVFVATALRFMYKPYDLVVHANMLCLLLQQGVMYKPYDFSCSCRHFFCRIGSSCTNLATSIAYVHMLCLFWFMYKPYDFQLLM